MKNFKKIGLASFLSLYLLGGLLFFIPFKSQAGIIDVDQDFNFKPQIGIPNSDFIQGEEISVGTKGVNKKGIEVMRSDLLSKYIVAAYTWGLSIVGVIAVVALMAAGILWASSGGKGENINLAKKLISNSLIGLTVLVGSYFLLNTINPNLANLPSIETEIINKKVMGCCQQNNKGKMTTSNDCQGGDFNQEKALSSSGKCEEKICCRVSINGNNNCVESTETCANPYVLEKKGKCVASDTCKEASIVKCTDKEEGERCGAYMNSCYCYDGVAYLTKGKLGEVCGKKNEGHGICIEKSDSCEDENDMGGRDCDGNLKCCLDNGIWL